MLSIFNDNRDIYFNLALEEYILKNRIEDVFILWQSETSVVVGKHQNTMAEINHSYIRCHRIPVARRLSGGGTVVHGPGNLNFTFVMNGEPGKMVNFQRFVTPIILFLRTLGLEAEIGTRNDLHTGGIKISGNAEHIFRQRMLHHGTLLYNADLKLLEESIRVKSGQYIDKAVKSHQTQVGNISSFLRKSISTEDFKRSLFQFLQDYFNVNHEYRLNSFELREIERLRNEKYSTREWIYYYSPPFEVYQVIQLNGQEIQIRFRVNKGIIRDASIQSSTMVFDWNELTSQLLKTPYEYDEIKTVLEHFGELTSDQIETILGALF